MMEYNVQDEPIVISKVTMDMFLAHELSSDLIALYAFYYYTAKWQKTNQPKCTTNYSAEGLGWTDARVRRSKSVLRGMGLIEDIQERGADGKMGDAYLKINFVWHHRPPDLPEGGFDRRAANHEPNALSAVMLNALSAVSKKVNQKEHPEPEKFVETRHPKCIRRRPIPEPERDINPQDIIRLWNNWVHQGKSPLPRVTKLTTNRESRLRTRIKEYPKLKDWRVIFDKILDSTFLQGGKNKKGWMVDLDWIIHNDERIVKILEGRYDDDRTSWAEEKEADNRPKQSQHEDRSTFSKYDNIKKSTYDPDNPTEVTI